MEDFEPSMKVKICGLTRVEDAEAALDAGADYLGFVFHPPSPRFIEPARAGELIRHFGTHGRLANGRARCVGLCVNLTLKEMNEAAALSGVDLLQVYGTPDPEDLTALVPECFMAVRPRSLAEASELAGRYGAVSRGTGPGLLVDSYSRKAWGGTGEQADWTLVRTVTASVPRTMLAGGLAPDNVAQAVAQTEPWGVDVSSGVEAAPGLKDVDAVRTFVNRARRAVANRDPDPAAQA